MTKRGKPVARITPVDPDASLRGTMTQLVSDDELVAPIGEGWKADAPPS